MSNNGGQTVAQCGTCRRIAEQGAPWVSVEHEAQPELFTDAFASLWWAVATLTTVGYGDIYPVTALGKVLSAVIAVLGVGLVAIPSGIISAGLMEALEKRSDEKAADERFRPHCGRPMENHAE